MRLIDADAFERAVMFSDDEDLQDVIYRLRDFQTAQPEYLQWIPCSERMPREGVPVMVCNDDSQIMVARWALMTGTSGMTVSKGRLWLGCHCRKPTVKRY